MNCLTSAEFFLEVLITAYCTVEMLITTCFMVELTEICLIYHEQLLVRAVTERSLICPLEILAQISLKNHWSYPRQRGQDISSHFHFTSV